MTVIDEARDTARDVVVYRVVVRLMEVGAVDELDSLRRFSAPELDLLAHLETQAAEKDAA